MNNRNKRMMLFCEPCGYKSIFEPNQKLEGLVEIKTSPIQTKIPQLDPSTQKTVETLFQNQAPKYKCPCCGRGVKLRELLKPFVDALTKIDEEKEQKKLEEEKQKRIADGKPQDKKADLDFLG